LLNGATEEEIGVLLNNVTEEQKERIIEATLTRLTKEAREQQIQTIKENIMATEKETTEEQALIRARE